MMAKSSRARFFGRRPVLFLASRQTSSQQRAAKSALDARTAALSTFTRRRPPRSVRCKSDSRIAGHASPLSTPAPCVMLSPSTPITSGGGCDVGVMCASGGATSRLVGIARVMFFTEQIACACILIDRDVL